MDILITTLERAVETAWTRGIILIVQAIFLLSSFFWRLTLTTQILLMRAANALIQDYTYWPTAESSLVVRIVLSMTLWPAFITPSLLGLYSVLQGVFYGDMQLIIALGVASVVGAFLAIITRK